MEEARNLQALDQVRGDEKQGSPSFIAAGPESLQGGEGCPRVREKIGLAILKFSLYRVIFRQKS